MSNTSDFEEKTEILSKLCAELDYQHPFTEGNSRTIRLFVSDMASKHGIELDWQNTAKNKDELYRARDFEVASRNLAIQPKDDLEAYMLEEAQRYKSKEYRHYVAPAQNYPQESSPLVAFSLISYCF